MGGREMDIYMYYLPSCQTTEYTISHLHMHVVMIVFNVYFDRLDYELSHVPLERSSQKSTW